MESCEQPVTIQAVIPSPQELLESLKKKLPTKEFRFAPKNPSIVQMKIGKKWRPYCVHGRKQSTCVICGGSEICKHKKVRTRCVQCGGVSICEHKKQKSNCKICGRSAFCEHGRQKNYCIPCGGTGICIHKRIRSTCRECRGSQICDHGKQKSHCRECKGSAFCKHGKQKSCCRECEGSGICEHKKLKHQCVECGGNSVCQCGKRLKQKRGLCPQCLGCSSEGCIGAVSRVFDFDFCYFCGCFKIGRTPQERRQDKVFDFIEENYPDCEIRYDKPIPDQNCTKFRPDVLFQLPFRKLICEIDEDSHKSAAYDCDTGRMSDLAFSGDVLPTVFIRYNPDKWSDPSGTKRKISDEQRLGKLREEVDRWLDPETAQDHFITVVYLYYDKSEEREEDFIPSDWAEQTLENKEEEPYAKRTKYE